MVWNKTNEAGGGSKEWGVTNEYGAFTGVDKKKFWK